MPNSKRYHGQSHLKGGITIDEDSIDPMAKYWAISARGAKLALERLLGEEKTEDLVKSFWIDGNTWKNICLDTEKILKETRRNIT